MFRTLLLTTLTLTALSAPARAEDSQQGAQAEKPFFTRVMDALKSWHEENKLHPMPKVEISNASSAEKMKIWFGDPNAGIQDIEPAAGDSEDETVEADQPAAAVNPSLPSKE